MAEVAIRQLRKSFGATEILKGVDLEVADHEFVVLLGASGCGKSTLLRLVAGLDQATSGDILIGGRRVNDLEPRRRDIAMVFQNYALYPHMSVFDNMAYGLKVAGVPRAEIKARVERTAEILELGPFLQRRPRALSGGQRQRVAMGRAIVREPSLFLFDEPLSNLDARLRTQMRVEIRRLQARLGITSLYVTHDQVEAMTLADRILLLNAGSAEQLGTPLDLYHRPASTFVAGFLGTPPMNLIPATVTADGSLDLGGTTLACPHSVEPGRPVILGIRPEHLHPAATGITVTVDLIEALGADTLIHGRLNHTTQLIARLPGAAHVPQTLTLAAHPDALHLFDPQTTRRLG
jgi:sn-glycerol 3-phosphate transport system ATP-binding protein